MVGAAAASALLGTAAAPAAAKPNEHSSISDNLQRAYTREYAKVKKLGGDPGRNLVADGVRKHGKERGARAPEIRHSLHVLERMRQSLTAPAPATQTTATTPATSSAAQTQTQTQSSPTTQSSSGGGNLSAIAACESGGNAGAVDSSGTYGGKYQFDQQTWQSVGGTGSPASAPAAVQDQMAQRLYAQRGASAWPSCGK